MALVRSVLIGMVGVLLICRQAAAADEVIKRTPKIEMYGCDDCHDSAESYNPTVRKMKEDHDTIQGMHPLRSDDPGYWCLNCHAENNYNKLRLQSGRKISFNESYLLCGECHGIELRDWKKKIHGKRVGNWNGPGQVSSCTECHDAHDPMIKPIVPLPPPAYPKGMGPKDHDSKK